MDQRSVLSVVGVFGGMAAIIVLVLLRASDTDSTADKVDGPGDTVEAPETPEAPETLEEFVAEAIEFIETTRGRRFVEAPVVLALPEADFVARIDADLESEFDDDPDGVAMYNGFYRAFGLIGPDESIDEVYRAFGSAGILGFYDPETDELVVRQVDQLSLLTKSTIVHELVHAFDDQHFDLDRPEYDDRTDEIPWTFVAVAEGNASYVESLWESTLSPADQAAVLAEELDFGDPSVFEQFELAFLWLELSPYDHGEPFIAELVARGGFDAVDEVLADPPATSEQVIDPTAFAAGEPALELSAPPADGEVLVEGVGGQVLLDSIFFGEGVDFGRAADGWGADRFVVWLEGEQTCVRWDLRADTPADLDELEVALDAWVNSVGSGAVARLDGQTLRVDRCV